MLLGVVYRRYLPYITILVLLMGAEFYIWWNGYNHGVAVTTLKYETAIQNERERLTKANEDALEEARKREAELNRLLRERNATIADLEAGAEADPNAARPAVSVDGVRRLNRVR